MLSKKSKGRFHLGSELVINIEAVSTGFIGLDRALGVGGLPKGRFVELFGGENMGKSTLALQLLGKAQEQGMTAVFADAEGSYTSEYTAKMGVNVNDLVLIKSDNPEEDTTEETLQSIREVVKLGYPCMCVVDSLAALVPAGEMKGEIGDQNIGLQARAISKALRMLAGTLGKSGSIVVFVNQLREKIGASAFEESTTTPGGRAVKFWASIRLDVRRISAIKEGEEEVGHRARVFVKKNKVAPPHRECFLDMLSGKGFSYGGDLLDMALEKEIVTQKGAWFNYGETRLGQGRLKVSELLENDDKLMSEIREGVLGS